MRSSVSILIVFIAILFTGCSNETQDTVKKEPPTTTQEANAQLNWVRKFFWFRGWDTRCFLLGRNLHF